MYKYKVVIFEVVELYIYNLIQVKFFSFWQNY